MNREPNLFFWLIAVLLASYVIVHAFDHVAPLIR